eukprot:TRINITY_DN17140_c0_g7_i1.p2 TRINITY_DN17140_c0_g7~~TRINITY_DN17140_c0_g7_i1.p2  ORF type:complete len:121 (-),score=36.00 TRINITY_DN17140_c0_g7_i1:92-454(-)
MEDFILQMSKLLDEKTVKTSSANLHRANKDMEKILEENKNLEEYVVRLQQKLEERESLEKQLMKEYKLEIEKFKAQWIPISKHEEIVNEELGRQEQEFTQSLCNSRLTVSDHIDFSYIFY